MSQTLTCLLMVTNTCHGVAVKAFAAVFGLWKIGFYLFISWLFWQNVLDILSNGCELLEKRKKKDLTL